MTLALGAIVINEELEEELEQRRYFTTMTDAGADRWPLRQVGLLISGDEQGKPWIVGAGLITRSYIPLAMGWHRLRYSSRVEIQALKVESLLQEIAPRFRHTVSERLTSGGVLPPASAKAAAKALQTLRPQEAKALIKILRDTGARAKLSDRALQAAAQEADAVRLAMSIARIPRRETESVDPDGERSFVLQLAEVRASEDTTIAYDAVRFLDFDRIDSPSGVVRFENANERLTVINVNRQPLEQTTGADLIYINDPIGSFILVQYKTMRKEGGKGGARYVYRPDQQLEKELELMRAIEPSDADGTPGDYRLSSGCCYLKICKPAVSLTASGGLAPGDYLPLEYYDVLAASDELAGPRGGVMLGTDTLKRSVDNTLFTALVRGGWIGSRGDTTTHLTELVLAGLDAGRTITVAASEAIAVGDGDGDL